MENFDVIIIGAGLAGLSLGSELSKKHNILVIEKGQIKKEHKTWTTEEAIVRDAGLEQFISVRFDKCYFKFLNKDKFYLYDKAVTVDDKAILNFFEKTIKNNQSKIMENCDFLDIAEKNDSHLTIKTKKGVFSTRLLIDCSGVDSTLTTRYKLYNKIFYYPVYGGIYDVSLKNKDIYIGEIMTSDYPINWLETFPITENQTLIYTFQYLKESIDPKVLKPIHQYQIKNCYLKNELKGKKMVREVYGVIPMGEVKKTAVDNIFFFGDTDLIGSPLAGSGFTNIIQHYKKIAEHISNNLTKNTLKEKDLNYTFSKIEQINRDIQTIIGLILINAKSKQVGLFFDMLKTFPNKVIVDTIFLRLTIEEIALLIKTLVEKFGFKQLASILPKKEYMFVAQEALKTIEDITIEEIEEIFN